MGVSKNRGTPKSSILIGFSLINHPFSGTTIFGNTHMAIIASCHHFIHMITQVDGEKNWQSTPVFAHGMAKCIRWDSLILLGMVIPPLIGNPYNG